MVLVEKDVEYEKKYFTCRDRATTYTRYTKEEIGGIVDPDNPESFIFLLKEMDYAWLPTEYYKRLDKWKEMGKTPLEIFGTYIAIMRLAPFRGISYEESVILAERLK